MELKNATLGDGVSAGHLSYLGDAEVGPRTNIGAGTITCNYDGVDKHRTVIGADAFIGTHSTLVAPVTLARAPGPPPAPPSPKTSPPAPSASAVRGRSTRKAGRGPRGARKNEIMSVTLKADIRMAAEELMRANIEAEPAIVKAYLFPSDEEIRLVYVDPTTSPLRSGERIAPFYFGASKSAGSSYAAYTIAVALILPDEAEEAQLPDNWGGWGDAEVIWEKPKMALAWRTAYFHHETEDRAQANTRHEAEKGAA